MHAVKRATIFKTILGEMYYTMNARHFQTGMEISLIIDEVSKNSDRSLDTYVWFRINSFKIYK